MTRPKLPKKKRKVRMDTTLDADVAKHARATGNASEFMNSAARLMMEQDIADAAADKRTVSSIAQRLGCAPKDVPAKIDAMLGELATLAAEYEKLTGKKPAWAP